MASWKPIPGETPIDPSQLVPSLRRTIRTRSELNLAEARNILLVMTKYLAAKPTPRQAPFTLKWAYKLHHEMFCRVWLFAGKKRAIPLNLGVAVHQIDTQLQQLLDDIDHWREHKTNSFIEQAARLHHRAVQIHPFENGNGRWSRLLADVWLKKNGEPIIQWPNESIANTSVIRSEYLSAIKAADAGEYTPLIELHNRYKTRK